MTARDDVLAAFREGYDRPPEFLVRAPGRANLIGEHTDYNEGFVMPLALDRAVWLAVSRRDDDQISVRSLDFGDEQITFSGERLEDDSLPHWSKYVRGAWWLMRRQGLDVPGANIVIGGDIPIGAGLSSSAAIGVGVVEVALALLGNTGHDQKEKALMAVEIENNFLGFPCGVMDPMASAAALDGTAMLLDCRSLEITPVPLPESVRVIVMNTMQQRELAEGEYAQRRTACEEAARLLGVSSLRDVTPEFLAQHQDKLDKVKLRRARHVIRENARTLNMKTALESGDLEQAGKLLNASHASLRDDFEVSVWALDVMSCLAQAHPSCYGARMMGGGFGGSAVGLVQGSAVDGFLEYLEPLYTKLIGVRPEFTICIPSPGSQIETLNG